MNSTELSKIRNDYRRGELDESHVDADPLKQFASWMEQAIRAGIEEPTAMTLATATKAGRPSARMVLLKGFDERGFSFFTNYTSRKALELAENPVAALVFYWKELERQVRIEGRVELVSPEESDAYFASRPEESRVSAIVSPQSTPVTGKKYLEEVRNDYLKTNPGQHIRPEYWGGYRLKPQSFEFWQGRPGRFHDRIGYAYAENQWKVFRLAP